MPRGNMPRQPSRSGRQEGARRAKGVPLKGTVAKNAAARAGKATKISVLKKKTCIQDEKRGKPKLYI